MSVDYLRILVVEDEIDEQLLTRRAIQKAMSGGSTVNVVGGGNEAIAYLIGEGGFSDRNAFPFPSLLICDLNMRDGDGFEVLEFMQANPGWNVVPRVIFSLSDDADDVRTAYLLGASGYHLKPPKPAGLDRCMREILAYWSTVQFPAVDESGRTLATSSLGRRGARYAQPEAGLQMHRPARRQIGAANKSTCESGKSADARKEAS